MLSSSKPREACTRSDFCDCLNWFYPSMTAVLYMALLQINAAVEGGGSRLY